MTTTGISIPRGATRVGTAARAAREFGTAVVAWGRGRQLPLTDDELARRHANLRALDARITGRDSVVHPLAR